MVGWTLSPPYQVKEGLGVRGGTVMSKALDNNESAILLRTPPRTLLLWKWRISFRGALESQGFPLVYPS